MSKYVILYRVKDSYYGCRYIELNDDGTIHTDWGGRPIISNATYVGNIREGFDDFDNVETWLTEDVFNRIKYADGTDTFSDVVDMIANGEHKEFEKYIRESEIEMMCEEYRLDREDVEERIVKRLNDEEREKFRFQKQNFESLELEKSNLIVANYSLPFCDKDKFEEVWNKIKGNILPNRIFCW